MWFVNSVAVSRTASAVDDRCWSRAAVGWSLVVGWCVELAGWLFVSTGQLTLTYELQAAF